MKKNLPGSFLFSPFKKICLLLSLFITSACMAQAPLLTYTPVVSAGLSSPVDVVNAGDGSDRLFIVQQNGTIKIISGGVLRADTFLNVRDSISIGGERGLLSMAFHPNYETNGYFFIYYTNLAGDITVARFRVQAGNANAADITSGVILMKIPKLYSNHNGGHLAFGPDGYLYFGTGDGGSGGDPNNNAQNGNSLLGKMIRLNVSDFTAPAPYYTIPADNPYVGDPNVLDEIFSFGLRNPFRWSFDRLTNDCWIGDVGQGAWEEIDRLPYSSTSGANYGWRCYEGNHAYNTAGCLPQSSYDSAIFEYPHNMATGGFAVTGGFVYRGTQYPALYGYYICADYSSANNWLIKPDNTGGWQVTQQTGLPGAIAAFGESENAELYALSLNGALYRVGATVVVPVTLQYFTAKRAGQYNELQWQMAAAQNPSRFDIEYSTDGTRFENAGSVAADNNPAANTYRFQHQAISPRVFYRIKIIERGGNIRYSQIIQLNSNEAGGLKIYPSLITSGQVNITTSSVLKNMTIFSADGKLVFDKRLNDLTGIINVSLPALNKGIYFIRLQAKERNFTEKIIIQ